jgi:hypothetical protein
MQRARLAAERVALEAREHLAAAQKSVERAREQAAVERIRRLAAERARRWAQTRRRASFAATRERLRSWCYSINGSNPSSTGTARLTGFCRG